MGLESAPTAAPQTEDRERRHTPEVAHERLRILLAEMAHTVNAAFTPHLPEALHTTGLVDERGAIRDTAYLAEHGGPLSEERIEEFRMFVKTRERDWCEPENPNVQDYYRRKCNAQTEEEILTAWRKERSMHDGALAEMAVTILMHKFLQDEFYVLRTNTYDDYAHGIDNLIIEKATGAVICTFDEFVGSIEDERFQKKLTRERKQARDQGAKIDYGIGITHQTDGTVHVERKAVRHVPTFTLPINKTQLHTLLKELGETLDQPQSTATLETFTHIITSLAEQATMFKNDLPPESPVRARADEFMAALARIQQQHLSQN
jgi:hypothetical protein